MNLRLRDVMYTGFYWVDLSGHIFTGYIQMIVAPVGFTNRAAGVGEKAEEMFLSCGRHPAVINLKTGVSKEGILIAQYMDVIDETGAYAFSGSSKMALESSFFLSCYKCPNMKFTGKTVYTNTPPLTAMRGAGNPQVHFAVESQMDIIAEKLGMDPIELRRKNYARVGDIFYGQGIDVTTTIKSCGLEGLFEKGSRLIGWSEKKKLLPARNAKNPRFRRGVGMAKGFHTTGAGSAEPSKFILDYSGALIRVNEDGSICLLSAACDMGTGTLSAHAAIAAEVMGIGIEEVHIALASDTDSTFSDVVTHASRGIYSGGLAVREAAENAKAQLLEWAEQIMEVPKEKIKIENGMVIAEDFPEKTRTLRDIVETATLQGWGTCFGQAAVRPTACPPHFTVCFAELEVDTLTGKVELIQAVMGADPGIAISKKGVEGQLGGAFQMGAGFALSEDTIFDGKDGRLLNGNFHGYKALYANDIPRLDCILEETFEPTGPYGAKGVGEGGTNPVAPAIINAIYDAIGVRIKELPATPEKILAGLKNITEQVKT